MDSEQDHVVGRPVLLGAGGFGQVLLVRYKSGRETARKVLLRETGRQRFYSEISILKRLNISKARGIPEYFEDGELVYTGHDVRTFSSP